MFSTFRNVAKHSVIYGLGDLLIRGMSFLLIPFYTHFLSTSDYGVLELLDLTSYVVGVLLAMGFGQAVTRFYFESEVEKERQKVISTALICIWCVCLAGLPVLVLGSKMFSTFILQSADYTRFFQIMFCTLALTLSNEIPLAWIRIRQQSVLFSCYSFSTALSTVLLNIFFLGYMGLGLSGVLYSGLITNSLGALFLLIYTLRRVELVFSRSLGVRMFHYGWPLIGSWLGGFILHFADRFLLQRYSSLSDVGIYALAYKFGFVLNIVVLTPFARTWGPKQFEVASEENAPRTFAAMLTYYCLIQALAALGIAVLIQDVILVLTDERYHTAYLYVLPLLVAYCAYGIFVFLEFGLLYHKKTRQLAFATIMAGAVNIAANLLLIPMYGAWGAAMATLISFFFLMVLTGALAQRLFYIPIEYGRIAKIIAASVLLYTAADAVNPVNHYLSIVVKGAIAACLPLVLFPLRFYLPEETARLKQLAAVSLKRLRRKASPAVVPEVELYK